MKLSLKRLFLFVSSAPGSPTTNSLKFFLLRTSGWCARSSTFTRCWFFKLDVVWVVIHNSNGRINRCRFFNLLLLLCEGRFDCRSARRVSTCNFLLLGLDKAGRALSLENVVVGRSFHNRFWIDSNRSARGSSVPTKINQVHVRVQALWLVLLIGPTFPCGVVELLAAKLLLLQKIEINVKELRLFDR